MKINIIFLGLFSIIFFMTGCSPKNTDTVPILSVSIEPQRYFLEQIVGDKFKVNCVIPAGSNPETYDPAPSQMVTLGKSRIYFKVGQLSFENAWIKNIEANNPELVIVDCSRGIDFIEEHTCHDHSHGHDGVDPHIWSSPSTASVMVKNMYDAVVESDPDNRDYYKQNLEKLLAKFAETDKTIKEYLAGATSRSFIIYHPALSYFSHEYGLNQYTIEQDGKNPSPAQMKTLIENAKQNKIGVVFIQKEFDEKNAETIAKEIGAKVVSINLLSYNWEEEMIKTAKTIALGNE